MTPVPVRPRWYIGLAATMHDPALAIVDPEGEIVFAEATERYLQCKRAYNAPPDLMTRVPELLHKYCPEDAELVVALNWSERHLQGLELAAYSCRLPERTFLPRNQSVWPLPGTAALALALRNSLAQAGLNVSTSLNVRHPVTLRRYDHHLCHAASGVFTSGFDDCTVAVVDGFGELGATSCFRFRDGRLVALEDAPPGAQPASLGFYYGRLCGLCGFDPIAGEEWKVMGLAAYGAVDAELHRALRSLITPRGLGFVAGCTSSEEEAVIDRLRREMRPPGSTPLLAADLARTGQAVFEEIMAELLMRLHEQAPSPRLVLAGGCALNSSFNGRILECTPFEELHVPSAPADDGTALGAALLAFGEDHGTERLACRPRGSPYLGSSIDRAALGRLVEYGSLHVTHHPSDVHERAAGLLAEGRIVGWVQGRAEFGPRALGNRSILADPRAREMQDRINTRVKFREDFRPLAPSILDGAGIEYFENYQTTPYMERTLRFRPRMAERVPAVVHVDGTGRLQSVRREWNPRYCDLLEAFTRRTGVPVILNTSLNVMGKPIAHSLEDALGVYLTTGMDALVIEDYVIEK
jgi:carbamoyltransferase